MDDFGRGTALCIKGQDWDFTWPFGSQNGSGRVVRVGDRVILVGNAPAFFVFAFGISYSNGPGVGLGIELSGFPFQLLRLNDITP